MVKHTTILIRGPCISPGYLPQWSINAQDQMPAGRSRSARELHPHGLSIISKLDWSSWLDIEAPGASGLGPESYEDNGRPGYEQAQKR
jgi:hypothetical protein